MYVNDSRFVNVMHVFYLLAYSILLRNYLTLQFIFPDFLFKILSSKICISV